ncbi:putative orphan protein [Pseudoalteromonas translucida]|uniref:Orphan protein n=1 Tax=Pseudoalteromonas translucida (strain TAC 125) TaxID=326442 RepID=Q3II71_PSET1|nr:putative orphan protein [Pseudoalteromonas translucida]
MRFWLCLAEINAPKKQLAININHNKVPSSTCSAKQQNVSEINAQVIAANQK